MSKIFHFLTHHKKLSLVALIIILLIGFLLWPKPAKPVLTESASVQNIEKTVSVTGNIEADNTVNLSFQIPGTLIYLAAKLNDTVKANQEIAGLDQRIAQKNLQTALLTYSGQRNTFDQTIYNNGGTANPVDAVNDSLKRVLQDNQYDLNKAVASVELQDLVRQESVLTTPISGIVTRADASTAGVNVTPATVFTITDPNSLNFKMEVDEADIGQVAPGQKVSVSLDAFPNDSLSLTVNKIDFVSHTTTSGGDAFYVQAKLPTDKNYRVGMSGNADIIVASKKQVLTIPESSIFDDTYVYLKSNKSYVKRKVGLGLQSDTLSEVTSGLSSGDIVAVDPSSVPQSLIVKQ